MGRKTDLLHRRIPNHLWNYSTDKEVERNFPLPLKRSQSHRVTSPWRRKREKRVTFQWGRLANAASARWWRFTSAVISHVAITHPWWGVMKWHLTSVASLPKACHTRVAMRKASDKSQIAAQSSPNWLSKTRKVWEMIPRPSQTELEKT